MNKRNMGTKHQKHKNLNTREVIRMYYVCLDRALKQLVTSDKRRHQSKPGAGSGVCAVHNKQVHEPVWEQETRGKIKLMHKGCQDGREHDREPDHTPECSWWGQGEGEPVTCNCKEHDR